MGRKVEKAVSAEELMARLEADPEYRARMREKAARRAAHEAECRGSVVRRGLWLMMVGACLAFGGCLRSAQRAGPYDEWEFRGQLAEAARRWLETGSNSDGRTIDSLVASVSAAEKPKSDDLMRAAQYARLRGHTREAMALLDKAVRLYPDARAPDTNLPVKILARSYKATMQRQGGDVRGALATYEELMGILDAEQGDQRGIVAMCHICIAAMAAERQSMADVFNRETEALLKVEETADYNVAQGLAWARDWAAYMPAVK